MFRSYSLAAALAAAVLLPGLARADVVRTGADLLMSCGKEASITDRLPCFYWMERSLDMLDWPARAFDANGNVVECPKTEETSDFQMWVPRIMSAFNVYWANQPDAARLTRLSHRDAATEALVKMYPDCSRVGSS